VADLNPPLTDAAGARASNAGDQFHELWALQQALDLLNPSSGINAVTVEGVATEVEESNRAVWDGVDCALYFGGQSLESAARIDIAQHKYSSTDPDKDWTVARLTYNKKKDGNNSALRRLADAFSGAKKMMQASAELRVRFISNQNIAGEVFDAISAIITEHKNAKGAAKDVLGAELIDTILKFWKHRAVFPRGHAPFENYDAVVRALESFDPDRDRYFSYAAANEVVDGEKSASRQLIELAKNLDRGTRALVNFCFTYAAYASGKPPKAWLDAARVLEPDTDMKLFIRFVDASETLDDSSKRKPTATELEIDRLKEVQVNLDELMESANTIGQAVEGRLKVLTSKAVDSHSASVAKKKSIQMATKDAKARSKKRLPPR
jgi:hypothetical protein